MNDNTATETPLSDLLQQLLSKGQSLLPSTGELAELRRWMEQLLPKAIAHTSWQPVIDNGEHEYSNVPIDRPVLVLVSWDEAPVVVWWDDAEKCWQYADETLSDNIGCCESFVSWAPLFDHRFFGPTVSKAERVAEAAPDGED